MMKLNIERRKISDHNVTSYQKDVSPTIKNNKHLRSNAATPTKVRKFDLTHFRCRQQPKKTTSSFLPG